MGVNVKKIVTLRHSKACSNTTDRCPKCHLATLLVNTESKKGDVYRCPKCHFTESRAKMFEAASSAPAEGKKPKKSKSKEVTA